MFKLFGNFTILYLNPLCIYRDQILRHFQLGEKMHVIQRYMYSKSKYLHLRGGSPDTD